MKQLLFVAVLVAVLSVCAFAQEEEADWFNLINRLSRSAGKKSERAPWTKPRLPNWRDWLKRPTKKVAAEDDEEADKFNWDKLLKYAQKGKDIYERIKRRDDQEETDAEFFKKIGKFFKKHFSPENIQKGLDVYKTIKGGDDVESDSEAGDLSVAQLRKIITTLSESRANELIGHLNRALKEGSINTCPRQAAFLAQLAHESGGLRWFEEFASGAAYEGRKDLGNTHPGDGKRYKGRGPIQLTGRANYRAAGKDLGLDLEGNPTQVATPSVGFRTAVWFWTTRSLNSLADKNTQASFDQITRRINGGTNGKADRDQYWRKAKSVLGC